MEKRWNGKLTNRDICRLLKAGEYSVDPEAGVVYGKRGNPLSTWIRKDPRLTDEAQEDSLGYLFVRIADGEKRRGVGVALVVWMAVTGKVIPQGFEIHHRDGNTWNNAWTNLYCLHKLDHQKLHGADLLEDPDDVPF